MHLGSIVVLAVGLAMDAAAVAATRGLAASAVRGRDVALVAILFGGFQAAMPLVGYAIGSSIGSFAAAWDHWLVFALLGGIGGKMILDARHAGDAAPDPRDPFRVGLLVVLAIATSIDALAVGVTLPMLDAPLVLSVATIGVTAALLSALGLMVGRRFGARLGRGLDAFGGVVLILLGTRILLDHLGVW